jgi:hypothetical protein
MKRGFVLHHNGPEARCIGQPHTRCVAFWDAVRSFHVNNQGWSDIAYSFGVCPHGFQFTGRGWNRNQFAGGKDVVGADDGPDSEWYSVLVFLGGTEKPTDLMVDEVIALIGEGRRSGRCGSRVLPHNAFKPKACPGPEFTAYARAWDKQALRNGQPPPPPAPEPEEPTMYVLDCAGKPALVVGLGGVQTLNAAQRSALKDVLGVEVKRNDDVTKWEALWSLRTAVAPVDVDEAAIAAAVTAALPDEVTDDLTVAEVVAAVRSVFADAGTES